MHATFQAFGPAGKLAPTKSPRYQRHQPEQTLLYQLVDKYYTAFLQHQAAEGHALPDYAQQEFTDFLECGRQEHGFLGVRCETLID